MMVTTKELMIGDWVGYRPGWINDDTGKPEYGKGDPFPVKVESIYDDMICWSDEDATYEAEDYELFPIPLTIELLEKVGFKQFHPSARLWEYGSKVYVDLHCPIDGRITIGIGGNSYELEYLHQLQHIMRFVGFEIKIEL